MPAQTKWIVVALALGVLAALPFLVTSDRSAKVGPPPAASGPAGSPGGRPVFATPVEVASVSVGRATEEVFAVGTLQANESVMVRPEITGRITRINFREGEQVEQGRLLVELDAAELEAQLAQASAELEIARLNHNRMRRLIANDNVSQQELDQAASTLKSARANYDLYKERLSKTRLLAPFRGFLGTRRVSPGDYVQPGRDIVNLEDIETLKIDFKVPETYLRRLSVGQRVEVRVDAFKAEVFEGRVYALDPRVDEVSRTVRVRARIPNPNLDLRPGLFANLTLVVGEIEHALMIPEEAVIPEQDRMYVFRVVDGTAHRVEIKLGLRKKGTVQVISGLNPGDTVVRSGHQKIRDGASVQPLNPAGAGLGGGLMDQEPAREAPRA